MRMVKRKRTFASFTRSFSSFSPLLSHGRACAAAEQTLLKLYSNNNNNNNNNGDKCMRDYVALRFVFCRHELMRQTEKEERVQ